MIRRITMLKETRAAEKAQNELEKSAAKSVSTELLQFCFSVVLTRCCCQDPKKRKAPDAPGTTMSDIDFWEFVNKVGLFSLTPYTCLCDTCLCR